MTSPPAPPQATESYVPLAESFLAMAKDCRYVASATHLILQSLEAWNIVNHSPSDAWYASALLYCILVLKRKAKTLGMDIAGLNYGSVRKINDTSISNSFKERIWIRSIFGISTLYFLHRMARRRMDHNPSVLRGSERLQAFRRRRRAMIERSQQQQQQQQGYSANQNNQQSQEYRTGDHEEEERSDSSAWTQLKEELRKSWQRCMENFMVYQTGGPHDLIGHQQIMISSAWWCLRIYAAYYCMDGRFPTPGHFLLRHQVAGSEKMRLVNRPQSHRFVAMLILSHTLGVTLQNMSTVVMRWLVERFSALNGNSTTPVLGASSCGAHKDSHSQPIRGICSICQQPRKHPACPIQCGHVFCWTCLQKWIQFRPECPVCRIASRPQDILPLYNYDAPDEPNHDNTTTN